MIKSNAKIVFIGINSSYSHTMLSYGYIRTYTEKHLTDLNWKYLESNIKDDAICFAVTAAEEQPDIILATAYLFNQEFLLKLLKPLKQLCPKCKIFLGGPQFLGDNREFLRANPEINGVIRGDESSVYRVISGDITSPGLCCITNDNYFDNGIASHLGKADEIPSPYIEGYYQRGKPFYQVETSRGCNGRCCFCTSALSNNVMTFSIDRIRNELSVLVKDGVKEIRIVDRTFNESTPRALELLRLFRDEFPTMRFHLEINPAKLNDSLLEMIKSFPTGHLHLEVGIQTFSDTSLKAVSRPANSQRSHDGLKQLTVLDNIEVHADLIAGLPEQNYRDLLHDIQQMVEIGPEEIQLENLKVLPGTPLEQSPSAGMIWNPLPPYDILETAGFTRNELIKTRILSKLIDGYYNVPGFRKLFTYCVKRVPDFSERFCEHVRVNCDPLSKHSPKMRLELLESFASNTNDKLTAELVRFTWLQLGISPDKYGIKVRKILPEDKLEGSPIWDSNSDKPAKRCFDANFNFNVSEYLTTGNAQLTQLAYLCRFFMVHGQNMKSIFKIS